MTALADGREVFEIAGKALAELYPHLRCDACGRSLAEGEDEIWAKVSCGYFCAECIAAGRHLTHPAACRVS